MGKRSRLLVKVGEGSRSGSRAGKGQGCWSRSWSRLGSGAVGFSGVRFEMKRKCS